MELHLTRAGLERDFQAAWHAARERDPKIAIGAGALGGALRGGVDGYRLFRNREITLDELDALRVVQRGAFTADAAPGHFDADAHEANLDLFEEGVARGQIPEAVQPRGVELIKVDPADAPGRLPALIEDMIANPRLKRRIGFGDVPGQAVAQARGAGIDIAGFRFSLQSDDVRHAWRRHGPASHDPNPLAIEDFARIPDILATGKLEETGQARAGKTALVFRSADGAVLEAVMEKRTRNTTLAFKTMYRKRGRPSREDAGQISGSPPSLTSATKLGIDNSLAPIERQGKTFTAAGRPIETQLAVVDGNRLVTSHDDALRANPAYPAALQPRERDRAASELQIESLAGTLEPERLGDSPDAATGAPIVGPDLVVESGNARTLAILRALRQGGITVPALLSQGSMFDEGPGETAKAFLALLFRDPAMRRAAGRRAIADALDAFLAGAEKIIAVQNLGSSRNITIVPKHREPWAHWDL